MKSRRRAAAAAIAAAVLHAASASALDEPERRDVLVLGGGQAFHEAVTVTLSPWALGVADVDAAPPSSDVLRAATEARALAERHHAIAVVWVAGGAKERQHALFVYDAATDQLVARPLAQAPPFDSPTAAAAALSVKTLLRASTVAPPDERLGARPAAAPAPPPPSPSPAPPPEAADASPTPAARPSEAAERVVVEVSGGARAVADAVDTRIGVGASAWLGQGRRLGVGLVGRAGPGLAVDTPSFVGRWSELGLAPSVRARVPLAPALTLEPRAGVGLHETRIDGVATGFGPANRDRFDASADIGCVIDVAIGRASRVGLEIEGSWVFRYQRYLVADSNVFELRPLQGTVGLRLATGLW